MDRFRIKLVSSGFDKHTLAYQGVRTLRIRDVFIVYAPGLICAPSFGGTTLIRLEAEVSPTDKCTSLLHRFVNRQSKKLLRPRPMFVPCPTKY